MIMYCRPTRNTAFPKQSRVFFLNNSAKNQLYFKCVSLRKKTSQFRTVMRLRRPPSSNHKMKQFCSRSQNPLFLFKLILTESIYSLLVFIIVNVLRLIILLTMSIMMIFPRTAFIALSRSHKLSTECKSFSTYFIMPPLHRRGH